jgi:hypothetical protein
MLRRTARRGIGKTTAGASPCDLLDYRCENQCVSDQQTVHTLKLFKNDQSIKSASREIPARCLAAPPGS